MATAWGTEMEWTLSCHIGCPMLIAAKQQEEALDVVTVI